MEAWPVVAWVLLITSGADVLKSVQSRDFTMMDIIKLHPSSRNTFLLFLKVIVVSDPAVCVCLCVCLLTQRPSADFR